MNDYVIINGVNSNTISGLKISKLPPITKPQMRTLIETIDGRDGDLITDLGYSAYDKQLEIGLWGTYDINEIISFFNQSGTITFSNEADKFYNFKIINQIDYQKLLKFKTAVVVMHCQPFKYPTNETPIEGTPTTITGEGESLTLNNTLEAPLEIDLKGNTYQYSTTGKNLFNKTDYTTIVAGNNGNATSVLTTDKITITLGSGNASGIYITNANIKTYIDNYNDSNNYYVSLDIKATRNTALTFGGDTRPENISASSTLSRIYVETKFVSNGLVIYAKSGYQTNDTLEITNIMISTSSNITYEPYTNGASPNPDYPQDIQVVSGDNSIKVEGKNLINLGTGTSTRNNTTLTVNNDTINLKSTGTTNYVAYGVDNELRNANYGVYVAWENMILKAGTYSISIFYISGSSNAQQSSSNYIRFQLYGRNVGDTGNVGDTLGICYIGTNDDSATFTISEDKEVNVCVYLYGNITVDINFKLQLEKGSSSSTYTPYVSQTYPITLPVGTELCKIGDYQDYIYKDSGKWYIEKYFKKYYLKDFTFSLSGRRQLSAEVPDEILMPSSNGATIQMLCSHYVKRTANGTYNRNQGISISQAKNIYIYDDNYNDQTSLGDYNTWVANNNPYFIAQLETPTNEEITDSTLIEQLNALEGANSYDNQTNVSQVNNNYPFWLSVSTTFNAPITINNIGNIYAKPILELEGSGNITINLNSQDILSISLGDTTTKIVIDIPNLEAYNPTDSTLMNRLVVGDYMKFLINSGNNTLKIDGNITSYRLTSYTRWI